MVSQNLYHQDHGQGHIESWPANRIKLVPAERHARQLRREQSEYSNIWQALDAVHDPEIPVLSIWEMGILQNVDVAQGKVIVTITPTYSGCPAMDVIREDIESALAEAGFDRCEVAVKLSPAWTTDWMTENSKVKMRRYGIAIASDKSSSKHHDNIICPNCESSNTMMLSEFGSTACKALMKCNDCLEPFDYFKKI